MIPVKDLNSTKETRRINVKKSFIPIIQELANLENRSVPDQFGALIQEALINRKLILIDSENEN